MTVQAKHPGIAFVVNVAKRLFEQFDVLSKDVIAYDASPTINARSTPLRAGGEHQGDCRYLEFCCDVEEFRAPIPAEIGGVDYGSDPVPETLTEHVKQLPARRGAVRLTGRVVAHSGTKLIHREDFNRGEVPVRQGALTAPLQAD
ncbi:hypothetical protein GCM10018954_018960 [Kutzneria kofuensis]